MSVQISVRKRNDAVIVDLAGAVSGLDDAFEVRKKIKELTLAGDVDLIVNLAGVNFMDMLSIEMLYSSAVHLVNTGGKISLENLTERVMDILKITKFDRKFTILTNEDANAQSFAT